MKSISDKTPLFSHLEPEDHMVRRVLMVGAHLNSQACLSSNDRALVALAAKYLNDWKIPLADQILHTATAKRDKEPGLDDGSIEVINILPEHGGRDFLFSDTTGDMVILCNIARDPPAHIPVADLSMRHSFASSSQHDNRAKWAEKLEDSQANIVMISNYDGFDPEEINSGRFATIRLSQDVKAFMLRKTFVEKAEAYLCLSDSPLLGLGAQIETGIMNFSYDTKARLLKPL